MPETRRQFRDFVDDENQESPSAPLRDTFRHLKMKYVELQEKFKKDIKSLEDQVDQLENENGVRQHRIETVEQDNSTLRSDLDQLRGTFSIATPHHSLSYTSCP